MVICNDYAWCTVVTLSQYCIKKSALSLLHEHTDSILSRSRCDIVLM